jgi:hypothetical protein
MRDIIIIWPYCSRFTHNDVKAIYPTTLFSTLLMLCGDCLMWKGALSPQISLQPWLGKGGPSAPHEAELIGTSSSYPRHAVVEL